MISVINSLEDLQTNGTFGKFNHVIMAQDWSCFNQSQINTTKKDIVTSSTITWEYTENGTLCYVSGHVSELGMLESCEKVRLFIRVTVGCFHKYTIYILCIAWCFQSGLSKIMASKH